MLNNKFANLKSKIWIKARAQLIKNVVENYMGKKFNIEPFKVSKKEQILVHMKERNQIENCMLVEVKYKSNTYINQSN